MNCPHKLIFHSNGRIGIVFCSHSGAWSHRWLFSCLLFWCFWKQMLLTSCCPSQWNSKTLQCYKSKVTSNCSCGGSGLDLVVFLRSPSTRSSVMLMMISGRNLNLKVLMWETLSEDFLCSWIFFHCQFTFCDSDLSCKTKSHAFAEETQRNNNKCWKTELFYI